MAERDMQPARPALIAYACIDAMRRIKQAIADDSLEDEACFARIGEIIDAWEKTCGLQNVEDAAGTDADCVL